MKLVSRLALMLLTILLAADTFLNFSEIERVRLPYTILFTLLFWWSSDTCVDTIKPTSFFSYGFMVYMYHYIVLESLEKIVWIILGDHEWAAATDFLLCPIVTLYCLITVFALLHRFLPKFYGLLSGGR